MKVYVHRKGKNFGPFSVAQIKEHLRANNFVGNDLACFDGSHWIKLSEVPGVSDTPDLAKDQIRLKTKNSEKEPTQQKAECAKPKTRKPVFKNRKRNLILTGVSLVFTGLVIFLSFLFIPSEQDQKARETHSDGTIQNISSEQRPASSFEGFDPRPAAEKIDSFLNANLKREKLQPNPIISDEQFLRRIYLSVIGRIPTILEANNFLNLTADNKHSL